MSTARGMDDIAEAFRGLKFRRRLFGGVDEADVWRQLERIQGEYRSAYERQQAFYEGILAEHGIHAPLDEDGESSHGQ